MCFRRIPSGESEWTDDEHEDPPDSSMVSSHDVDSELWTRWCFTCVVCCGCSNWFCSSGCSSLAALNSGDLDLLGDRGGGMYVRSIGDSRPGARRAPMGFTSRPGGGCRWNCEFCMPLCTSRIAVEMTDSLAAPNSVLRRGNWFVGCSSGSAFDCGLSNERSFMILVIVAVCTMAGSSSSIKSIDRCSSSDSPLIGRAGNDFPLWFEYPGSNRRSSSMRLL